MSSRVEEGAKRSTRHQDRMRAENEEPWEPPSGMTKRRCTMCEFWFSAAPGKTRCPDCLENERRGRPHS
jgi:rubrerythrin